MFWAEMRLATAGVMSSRVSKEADLHRRMTAKRRSPHIINFRGEKINYDLKMTRIALDLDFGDGHKLRTYFSKQTDSDVYMRIHFLYCMFLALVKACEKMKERDIIHRDLKVWQNARDTYQRL